MSESDYEKAKQEFFDRKMREPTEELCENCGEPDKEFTPFMMGYSKEVFCCEVCTEKFREDGFYREVI